VCLPALQEERQFPRARIGIELIAGFDVDRTNELRSIIEGLTAAYGGRARQTISARYRLARQLIARGLTSEARAELQDSVANFDPAIAPTHRLLISMKSLLESTNGGPAPDNLIA